MKQKNLFNDPDNYRDELRITNYELRITNYELRITNYVKSKFQKFLPLILAVLVWWPDVGWGQCTNDQNCVQLITSNDLELDPIVAPNPMFPPSNGFQTFQLGYVAGWHSSHNTPHHFKYLPGVLCESSWTTWDNVIPCIGANKFQNEGIYTDLPLTEDPFVWYCLNLNVQKMNCGDDQNLDFIVSLTSGLDPFPPNTPIKPDPTNAEQILRTEFLNDYSLRQVSESFQVMPGSGYNQLWLHTKYKGIIGQQNLSGVATANSISLTCRTTALTGITANVNCGTVNFQTVNASTMSFFESFRWDFGDPSSGAANTSSLANPSHVYTQNGTYNVCVDVIDNNGCCARRCTSVIITDLPNFFIQQTATSPCSFTFVATGIQNDQVGVTYSWNFGDGTTGNGKFVNHTYTSSGTYTVSCTVTNNCGSITQSVIVVVNLPVLNAGFTVQNNCPSYTFTVTNPVPNATYTWSTPGGTPAGGTGTTFVTNYAANGPYIVTLNAVDICGQTISNTQQVNVNCNSFMSCATYNGFGINIGDNPNTDVLITTLLQGSNPVIPSTTISGQTVVSNQTFDLQGRLIINTSIRFEHCTWICNSGTEIVIQSGRALTLSDNQLLSCTNMWRGINVGGGTIQLLSETIISDAQFALRLDDGSRINVNNAHFVDNQYGIYTSSSPTTKNVTVYGNAIRNTRFEFESMSLRQAYFGMIGYSVRPKSGAYFTSVSSRINFTNCNFINLNGIALSNSQSNVEGGTFRDNRQYNDITGILFNNSGLSNRVRGASFRDCLRGIRLVNCVGSKVRIENNDFEMQYSITSNEGSFGIYATGCYNSSIIISNVNQFSVSNGTSISINGPTTYLKIDDNIFNTVGNQASLMIFNGVNAGHSYISNNRINGIQGNLRNKIELLNCQYFDIIDNDFDLSSNAGTSWGLYMLNTGFCVVRDNNFINGSRSIRVRDGNTNTFCCNYTDQSADYSFESLGYSPSVIQTNTLHHFIFQAGGNGFIGPQENKGNLWSGSGSSAVIVDGMPDVAVNNYFRVDKNVADAVPDDIQPSDLSDLWFKGFGSHPTCQINPGCALARYYPYVDDPDLVLPVPNDPTGDPPPPVPPVINDTVKVVFPDCHLLSLLYQDGNLLPDNDPLMQQRQYRAYSLVRTLENRGLNVSDKDCVKSPLTDDPYLNDFNGMDKKVEGLGLMDGNTGLALVEINQKLGQLDYALSDILAVTPVAPLAGELPEDALTLMKQYQEAWAMKESLMNQFYSDVLTKADIYLKNLGSIRAKYPFMDAAKSVWLAELKVKTGGIGVLSEQEWKEVREIADMCPATTGSPVYRAQSLLTSKGEYVRTDYDHNCTQGGFRSRMTKRAEESFITPNPSSGLITITWPNAGSVDGCEIRDVSGRPVFVSKIPANPDVHSLQLDLNHVEPGVYFWNLLGKGNIISHGKVIIIK